MFNKVQLITSQNLTFIRQVLHGAIMSYMEAAALALGKKRTVIQLRKAKQLVSNAMHCVGLRETSDRMGFPVNLPIIQLWELVISSSVGPQSNSPQ